MSFFNKVFASIGIGTAKVDTKLENEKLVAGEAVRGVVQIIGGNVEQNIDSIYLSLVTYYYKEVNDRRVKEHSVIEKFRISEPFVIQPNQKKEIPFAFVVPFDAPITLGQKNVWVQTGLDIKMALDPTDKDYVEILPTNLVQEVISAMEGLGFKIRHITSEYNGRLRKRLPFVQEFEFVPLTGIFRSDLDEVDMIFFPQEDRVEIVMELDKRGRGLGGLFSEALDLDERKVRFTVNKRDVGYLEDKIRNLINQYL